MGGHDIGLMVPAYAYAAQSLTEVEKLVVMDAFLPGVNGREAVYNLVAFHFNGPTPDIWCKGVSGPTLITTGTNLPPIRRTLSRGGSRDRDGRLCAPPDECAPAGRTLFHSCRLRKDFARFGLFSSSTVDWRGEGKRPKKSQLR